MDNKNKLNTISEMIKSSAKQIGSLLSNIKAKKSYMTFALIVLLIVAAIITVIVRSCTQAKAPDSDLLAYYSADTDSTYLYTPSGNSTAIVSGKAKQLEISPSGSYAAALDMHGNLYMYASSSVTFVTDSVTSFTLSADGDSLLYRTSSGELYRYRAKNSIKEKISEDVSDREFRSSPDGLSVVFRNENDQLILISGASRIDIGNYYPISVADKGKVIFLRDAEARLYVSLKGDPPGKLSSDPISDTPIANRTMTDLVFFSGDTNYISVYGAEPKKLAGSAPISCFDAKLTSNSDGSLYIMRESGFGSRKYISGGAAYAISQDHKATPIISDKETIRFFDNDVYYISDSALFSTSSGGQIVASASDFVRIGKYIYYIDERGDLYAGKNTYSRIAYDVCLIVPFDSGVLIALDESKNGDFTLYYSKSPDQMTKIGESCNFAIDIMHFR